MDNDADHFQSANNGATVEHSDTTEKGTNQQEKIQQQAQQEESENVKNTAEKSSEETNQNGATKKKSKDASPTNSKSSSIDAYEDDPVKLLKHPMIQKKHQKRNSGAKTFACTHKVGCVLTNLFFN